MRALRGIRRKKLGKSGHPSGNRCRYVLKIRAVRLHADEGISVSAISRPGPKVVRLSMVLYHVARLQVLWPMK